MIVKKGSQRKRRRSLNKESVRSFDIKIMYFYIWFQHYFKGAQVIFYYVLLALTCLSKLPIEHNKMALLLRSCGFFMIFSLRVCWLALPAVIGLCDSWRQLPEEEDGSAPAVCSAGNMYRHLESRQEEGTTTWWTNNTYSSKPWFNIKFVYCGSILWSTQEFIYIYLIYLFLISNFKWIILCSFLNII